MVYHSDEIPLDIGYSLTDMLPMHCVYWNFDTIKIVLSWYICCLCTASIENSVQSKLSFPGTYAAYALQVLKIRYNQNCPFLVHMLPMHCKYWKFDTIKIVLSWYICCLCTASIENSIQSKLSFPGTYAAYALQVLKIRYNQNCPFLVHMLPMHCKYWNFDTIKIVLSWYICCLCTASIENSIQSELSFPGTYAAYALQVLKIRFNQNCPFLVHMLPMHCKYWKFDTIKIVLSWYICCLCTASIENSIQSKLSFPGTYAAYALQVLKIRYNQNCPFLVHMLPMHCKYWKFDTIKIVLSWYICCLCTASIENSIQSKLSFPGTYAAYALQVLKIRYNQNCPFLVHMLPMHCKYWKFDTIKIVLSWYICCLCTASIENSVQSKLSFPGTYAAYALQVLKIRYNQNCPFLVHMLPMHCKYWKFDTIKIVLSWYICCLCTASIENSVQSKLSFPGTYAAYALQVLKLWYNQNCPFLVQSYISDFQELFVF